MPGDSFFHILFFGITVITSKGMGNILFNSFRMDTGMHLGTYWLKSRNIIVYLMKYIKNYIFCTEIVFRISNTLYKQHKCKNPLKICNPLAVLLKVYN
jgi:hypothetical protein